MNDTPNTPTIVEMTERHAIRTQHDGEDAPPHPVVNLRRAWAICGILIGEGQIHCDFSKANWNEELEHTVQSIAATLDFFGA